MINNKQGKSLPCFFIIKIFYNAYKYYVLDYCNYL